MSERLSSAPIRWLVVCVFLAIVGFFLLMEHRAHLFGLLPYVLLLACPVLHLLLHGKHDHHDDAHQSEKSHPGSSR